MTDIAPQPAPSLIAEQKIENKKHTCPKCKGGQPTRIHRGILIKALFPRIVKRYQCGKCLNQFYAIG